MNDESVNPRQAVLRSSVGPFSAGTPVRILAEGGYDERAWVDVQTLNPMPYITNLDMINGRPIITGLHPDWLVFRRARTRTIRVRNSKKK